MVCDVFKEVNVMRFLTFRDMDKTSNGYKKKVYDFDIFESFLKSKIYILHKKIYILHKKIDINFEKFHEKCIGFSLKKNYKLIKSHITTSIKKFEKK